MQVKTIAECSKGSILQYIRPSLSNHLSLRSLFCLFLSGPFTQVLLYTYLGSGYNIKPIFKLVQETDLINAYKYMEFESNQVTNDLNNINVHKCKGTGRGHFGSHLNEHSSGQIK